MRSKCVNNMDNVNQMCITKHSFVYNHKSGNVLRLRII